MISIESIRKKILHLYESDPHIHVNVAMNHPRIQLQNAPVTLKGVYPHIFQIEEYSRGVPECHTLQYADILSGQVGIVELGRLG